jgi:hypothetical protein
VRTGDGFWGSGGWSPGAHGRQPLRSAVDRGTERVVGAREPLEKREAQGRVERLAVSLFPSRSKHPQKRHRSLRGAQMLDGAHFV